MKKTIEDTPKTTKTTRTAKTTKTTKTTTTEKKTRTTKKKIEEEVKEPTSFKSLKEEKEWLKSKKKLEPIEKMRLDFLSQPTKAYTDYESIKEAKKSQKKKKTAKRKKKPVVLHENGEYVETPTTYTKLKSYINTYCKAVGWKNKKFRFPVCPNLGFKDFKVDGDKDKKEVYIKGNLIFQSSKQMFTKPFSKTFTLENHRDIRSLIRNTYSIVEKKWKDIETVNGDKLSKNGWCSIYDV